VLSERTGRGLPDAPAPARADCPGGRRARPPRTAERHKPKRQAAAPTARYSHVAQEHLQRRRAHEQLTHLTVRRPDDRPRRYFCHERVQLAVSDILVAQDPAGTAPQAKDSTANAVHGTYDIAGATVEDNTLWGGSCILFDNGPRLRVDDNPAIENADRITIEAWVNTLSWPTRAVICRKEGSYILYNYVGGFSWYLFGPDNRLQYDIAGMLGNGAWGCIVGTYDKDAGPNNQRLYLNGTRVAQMSDTQPIDLNSNPLGIGRHVRRIADPLQWPHRRVPHRARAAFRWLDPDHLEQHERPRCLRCGRGRGAGRQ
jgi:Concanavalin A-like lectin/glucanases superfamily